MLRIYSDRNYLPPRTAHVEMLDPFWGPPQPARHPILPEFSRYAAAGRTLFELTALEAADLAVLPFDWEVTLGSRAARGLAHAFARLVDAARKPLVVFFCSDSNARVPLPATVLRTSITRSSRGPREFAIPHWNDDLLARFRGGRLSPRARRARPIVGFCGRVPSRHPLRTAIAGLLKRAAWDGARGLRPAALDALRAAPRIEARIIERRPYFGDVLSSGRPADRTRGAHWRTEYVENLIGSDYALCVRGVGRDYSHRFGEALCCGRIPVVVESDVVLAYEWEVEWRSYGVWIRPDELDRIGELVADFNADLSDGRFVELQHECRRLWEERLSPEGYFRHFHRHFAPGAPGR